MLKKVFILHLSLFLLLSAVSFSQENKDKLTFILGGDLWISNSDGTGMEHITDHGGASEPSWSPDGKSIVFVCDKKIWKYDFSSGKSNPIFDGQGYSMNPSFSPDGSKIVFVRESNIWSPFAGKYYTEICIMNSDGTDVEVLLAGGDSWKYYPKFSPWGEEIVFNELKNNTISYYLATYNFIDPVDYLSSSSGWLEPDYSPNGNFVAAGWYSYDTGGGLCVINLKTLQEKRLLWEYVATQFTSPSFSSDGTRLIFEKQLYSQNKKMFIPYGIYKIDTGKSDPSLILLDASDPDWL